MRPAGQDADAGPRRQPQRGGGGGGDGVRGAGKLAEPLTAGRGFHGMKTISRCRCSRSVSPPARPIRRPLWPGPVRLSRACALPAARRVRGDYRAIGTEPFWDLTIGRDLVFTDRGNNISVAEPAPPVRRGRRGRDLFGRRLRVNIDRRRVQRRDERPQLPRHGQRHRRRPRLSRVRRRGRLLRARRRGWPRPAGRASMTCPTPIGGSARSTAGRCR